ncbi:MAG: hypothetical protein NT062_23775 [Proteobacteria bacterium]|nr:hypothetical protein [Pseudomonadota bacterium]
MKLVCLATCLLAALALPGDARGGPLADALAHQDVAALRARRDDLSARCTLAVVYARRGDLTRASIYLTGCRGDDVALDPDVAATLAPQLAALGKTLKDSALYWADLQSTPDGLTIAIDALPDERIVTPAAVYLAPGTYVATTTSAGVTYQQEIHAAARTRGPTIFITRPPTKPTAPKTTVVDMTEDSGGGEVQHTAGPKDIKHPSLISDKFRGITTASGPPIDDPLAPGPMQRHDRSWSIGGRIGGGLFDDATTAARAGLTLAAVGRVALPAGSRLFVDGRFDWSRRGGAAGSMAGAMAGATTHGIDTLGVTPGFGIRLVEREAVVVSATVGPRIDVRLQDHQGDAAVARLGVAAVAAVDVALQAVPITAGLRVEQGLTELRTGQRDHAFLLEIGVDWR